MNILHADDEKYVNKEGKFILDYNGLYSIELRCKSCGNKENDKFALKQFQKFYAFVIECLNCENGSFVIGLMPVSSKEK